PQAGLGDQLDGAIVVLGDPRKAGLDPVDPELVEPMRDLELLLGIEDDADGLLAVAKGRVVEADRASYLRLERAAVQVARPEEVAHTRTIPSGKPLSFSAPSAVTRKLSSSRRPPPPSQ